MDIGHLDITGTIDIHILDIGLVTYLTYAMYLCSLLCNTFRVYTRFLYGVPAHRFPCALYFY
jgi:hypothetical protein